MSVVFSGSFSGRFVSTGNAQFIPLPSGVARMTVTNETVCYAGGAGAGAVFEWSLGDVAGRGTVFVKEATIGALVPGQIAVASGFYLVDQSINVPGPLNNGSTGITAVSTATPPRVTVGSTAGMPTGTIVRLYDVTGATQLDAYDFSITLVDGTHFDLTNGPVIGVAGTGGSFRVVGSPYFYPPERDISGIQLSGVGTVPAGVTRVTMMVKHLYTIGQRVNIIVPSTQYGTIQLNNINGTIVAINIADANGFTNTIDLNIDSSAMTTFTFPLAGGPGFGPAQVVPLGMTTAQAIASNTSIIGDATVNTAQLGMLLMAGAGSPAGVTGNVITWIAYQSFNQ